MLKFSFKVLLAIFVFIIVMSVPNILNGILKYCDSNILNLYYSSKDFSNEYFKFISSLWIILLSVYFAEKLFKKRIQKDKWLEIDFFNNLIDSQLILLKKTKYKLDIDVLNLLGGEIINATNRIIKFANESINIRFLLSHESDSIIEEMTNIKENLFSGNLISYFNETTVNNLIELNRKLRSIKYDGSSWKK